MEGYIGGIALPTNETLGKCIPSMLCVVDVYLTCSIFYILVWIHFLQIIMKKCLIMSNNFWQQGGSIAKWLAGLVVNPGLAWKMLFGLFFQSQMLNGWFGFWAPKFNNITCILKYIETSFEKKSLRLLELT